MTVYSVRADGDTYQSFVIASDRVEEKLLFDERGPLDFNGSGKADFWKPPEVKIWKPRLKPGDFPGFNSGAFAVSPQAWETAAMFLEMAGELLPLPYKGEEFAVLNVTECIDCINEKKSEWRDLSSGRRVLRRPYFEPGLFGESSIFKLPQNNGSRIYCYEASGDPETEFKAFVEKEKLTGLEFNEVWSAGKKTKLKRL